MRIADRNGAWKVHPDEQRLLVRREPDEDDPEAQYYRVYPRRDDQELRRRADQDRAARYRGSI